MGNLHMSPLFQELLLACGPALGMAIGGALFFGALYVSDQCKARRRRLDNEAYARKYSR